MDELHHRIESRQHPGALQAEIVRRRIAHVGTDDVHGAQHDGLHFRVLPHVLLRVHVDFDQVADVGKVLRPEERRILAEEIVVVGPGTVDGRRTEHHHLLHAVLRGVLEDALGPDHVEQSEHLKA